ncbi:hypothetical protein SAMN05443247_01087 [Bradyrhizobium erythrophlei]|nr:hypothetical protein SAMN05443247_01087 [Bradyrhizobium erythrophlei]
MPRGTPRLVAEDGRDVPPSVSSRLISSAKCLRESRHPEWHKDQKKGTDCKSDEVLRQRLRVKEWGVSAVVEPA